MLLSSFAAGKKGNVEGDRALSLPKKHITDATTERARPPLFNRHKEQRSGNHYFAMRKSRQSRPSESATEFARDCYAGIFPAALRYSSTSSARASGDFRAASRTSSGFSGGS